MLSVSKRSNQASASKDNYKINKSTNSVNDLSMIEHQNVSINMAAFLRVIVIQYSTVTRAATSWFSICRGKCLSGTLGLYDQYVGFVLFGKKHTLYKVVFHQHLDIFA